MLDVYQKMTRIKNVLIRINFPNLTIPSKMKIQKLQLTIAKTSSIKLLHYNIPRNSYHTNRRISVLLIK